MTRTDKVDLGSGSGGGCAAERALYMFVVHLGSTKSLP